MGLDVAAGPVTSNGILLFTRVVKVYKGVVDPLLDKPSNLLVHEILYECCHIIIVDDVVPAYNHVRQNEIGHIGWKAEGVDPT